jgi:hypothetical protein
MKEILLPHKFTPRSYQVPLFNCIASGMKRGVAVWHRRAGKDKTLINIVAKEMFKRVGAYYYFFPTYSQGRKILWDGMDRDGMPFLDHIPKPVRKGKPNSTEMKLKVVNGSLFQVVGSDNINTIVGTNPVGCVFSEYALQDPRGWDFIRPILLENDGWALFNFTPRGFNHGWEIFDMASGNDDWFCQLLTVNDTKNSDGSPIITADAIQSERNAGMSEDLIQQEYYCSFEASIPGAYYASEIRLARDQGRICSVPVDPSIDVSTYWDIGIDDSMTIWFAQTSGREVLVVNYEECSGEGLSYYVKILKDFSKKYAVRFEEHVLPHDGENRSPQTGKSTAQYLTELLSNQGVSGSVRCAERPPAKEEGIEAVRQILPKCVFDKTRCSRGIDALTQYRKEYDPKAKVYKMRPVHDWSSHGADGFQTLALGHKFRSLSKNFRPNRSKIKGKFSRWRRRAA